MHTDLPLFAWQPPCELIAFPMVNRVGKIRDVAAKLLDKSTDRHAEYYRVQVEDGLIRQFERLSLSHTEIDHQLRSFWSKVDEEVVRLTYQPGGAGTRDPRGAA